MKSVASRFCLSTPWLKYVSLNNILKMETKAVFNYEAPQVEIIEVEVEQGFASSMDFINPDGDY